MASKARQAADEVNRQQAGRRNLIINGSFDVWQRGTSFNNISSQYCADRFYYVRTHTVDVDRVSCSLDGFKYANKITNETAGVCKLYQYIENTGQFYEGQKLTLSFWIRASEVATLRTGRTWDGSAYVTGYETFDTSTSWVRQTTTITVNSNWSGSESYFGVQVFGGHATNMSAGSWIEITGVQLEVGEVATPFEHRSYGEELALCQRYYEVYTSREISFAPDNQNGNPRMMGTFAVTKRAQPTMTATDSWVLNGSVNAYEGYHGTTNNQRYPDFTADAEL